MKFVSQYGPLRASGWLLIFIVEGILVAALVILLPLVISGPEPERISGYDADMTTQVVDGRPVQELYRLHYLGSQANGWTREQYQVAARFAARIGRPERSLNYQQAAFAQSPENAALAIELAERYLEQQDWARAVQQLQRAAVLRPDDGWVKTQLGLILAPQDAGQALQYLRTASSWVGYDETVARLLPLLEMGGHDVGSTVQIGLIYGQAGLWAYAEHAFGIAAAMEPLAEYTAYIGLAREMQGKSGRQWIDQAVRQAPDNALVQYIQGIFQRAQRDYQASVTSFTTALVLDPLNPAYYAEIGQTYREIGDVVNADYWLRQAVTVSNQDPQFEAILTQFYQTAGPALAAVGVQPDGADDTLLDADAQAEIGWTLHRIGRPADAETAFGVALALEPDNIRVTYYRGRIALEQGDHQTARLMLEAVVARDVELVSEAQGLLDLLDTSTQ